ncbi:MAG: hypothetical protein R3220_12355, partial [Balneolaceae bacterium]|nr:hypothetical protein [Balneolaceae bacterium]
MKTKEPYPVRLDVSCLPGDIYVSYEPFETDINSADPDIIQNLSGRNLIKEMAGEFLNEQNIQILTQ